MLVMPSGKERTESEWRALLQDGGFALEGVVQSALGQSVVEARPA